MILVFKQCTVSNVECFVAQLSVTGSLTPLTCNLPRHRLKFLNIFGAELEIQMNLDNNKNTCYESFIPQAEQSPCVLKVSTHDHGTFPLHTKVAGTGNKEGPFPLVTITQTAMIRQWISRWKFSVNIWEMGLDARPVWVKGKTSARDSFCSEHKGQRVCWELKLFFR